MQPERFESRGIGVQRVRAARLAAWASLVAIAGVTALYPLVIGVSFYGILLSVGILIGLHLGGERPPPERRMLPGVVRCDAGAIELVTDRGLRRIPRARLVGGWIDAFRDDHRVVLRHDKGDRVWIRVRDREEGQRLLRAAGFAAEQHTFRARLVSVAAERLTHLQRVAIVLFLAYGGPIALGIGVATIAAGHSLALSLGIAATALAALVFGITRYGAPRAALVGTDGVTIKDLYRRTFVPFAEVERVHADHRGVWLERRGGDEVLLATSPQMKRDPFVLGTLPSADALVLLERIQEARAAGVGGGETARFAALDRRGRPIEDWTRALRALVEHHGAAQGYREASVEQDELARLLESASAPPERRIAAALALSAAEDEGTRARLRFAVDTCANEDLRAALEHAAEGDLAEEVLKRAVGGREA